MTVTAANGIENCVLFVVGGQEPAAQKAITAINRAVIRVC